MRARTATSTAPLQTATTTAAATTQLPPFAPLAKIRREIPDSAKNHGSQILFVVVAVARTQAEEGGKAGRREAVYLQQASGQELPSSVAATYAGKVRDRGAIGGISSGICPDKSVLNSMRRIHMSVS